MHRQECGLALLMFFAFLAILGFTMVPARATEPELFFFRQLPAHPTEMSLFWSSEIALGPEGNLYVTVSRTDFVDPHHLTMKYDPWGNRLWLADYTEDLNRIDIAVDASGNALVAGQYKDQEDDPWGLLIKYDADGTQIWDVVFEGGFRPDDHSTLFNPVAVDAYGSVYARGVGSVVAKYDPGDGGEIWAAPFGDGDGSEVISNAVDPSGHLYAIGLDSGVVLTVKYDPEGAQLWSAPIAPEGTASICPLSIALDGSAAYVAANTWDETTEILDCLTVKYDADGNELWRAHFTETHPEDSWPWKMPGRSLLQVDVSGNVHVAPPGFRDYGYLVIKYDSEGNKLWEASVPSADRALVQGLGVDFWGNAYLTGCGMNAVLYPAMTFKFDSEGGLIWDTPFMSFLGNIPYSMAVTPGGSVYVAGGSGPVVIPDLGGIMPMYGFLIKYVEASSSDWGASAPAEAGTGPAGAVSARSSTALDWLPPLMIPFFVLFALRRRRKKLAAHSGSPGMWSLGQSRD